MINTVEKKIGLVRRSCTKGARVRERTGVVLWSLLAPFKGDIWAELEGAERVIHAICVRGSVSTSVAKEHEDSGRDEIPQGRISHSGSGLTGSQVSRRPARGGETIIPDWRMKKLQPKERWSDSFTITCANQEMSSNFKIRSESSPTAGFIFFSLHHLK